MYDNVNKELIPTLLQVNDLTSFYKVSKFFIFRKKVPALNKVSFALKKGETIAITGDAGSGKSTLLKCLNGRIKPQQGSILVHGKPYLDYDRDNRVKFIRMLYPHPETSLNPHLRILAIFDNTLINNTKLTKEERYKKINDTLEYVGLHSDITQYYPSMLSDILKLKLSLAYALILEPAILLVDDTIERLDAQTRSVFINIFLDLQKQYGTSLIICLNNLDLIRHMADKILVLNHGNQEDYGLISEVLDNPKCELTKKILQSYNHEYRANASRTLSRTK